MALEFGGGLNLALATPFAAAVVAPYLKRLMGHNVAWLLALVPAGIFVYLCQFIGTVATSGHGVHITYRWNGCRNMASSIPSLSMVSAWFLRC